MLLRIGHGDRPAEGVLDLLMECHHRIRFFTSLAKDAGAHLEWPDQEVVHACQQVARYFGRALPLHVEDEEETLLPALAGAGPAVTQALEEMERQHQAHAPLLKTLLETSKALIKQPQDAPLRAALAQVATTLEAEFHVHLTLEETVIFPAARALLSKEQQDQMVLTMRARRNQAD